MLLKYAFVSPDIHSQLSLSTMLKSYYSISGIKLPVKKAEVTTELKIFMIWTLDIHSIKIIFIDRVFQTEVALQRHVCYVRYKSD